MRHHHISGLLIIAALFASCGPGRDLAKTGTGKMSARTDASTLYERLTNGETYAWYSGKARLKATTPDSRMSASLNLRMVRDSVIWVNIEKLGFEVARVLITPDSVHMIDRINKEYLQQGLEEFLHTYGVHIGFADLQNTLTGQMIALYPSVLESRRESDLDILVVQDPYGVVARHWVSARMPLRLMKSHLVDREGRLLEIENLLWSTIADGSEAPFGRLLSFEDHTGRTQLEMTFSEITTDPPSSLPFSIPQHYARVR